MQVPSYNPERRKELYRFSHETPDYVADGMSDEQFGFTYDPELRKQDPYGAMTKRFNPFNPKGVPELLSDKAAQWSASGADKIGNMAQSGNLGALAVGGGAGALGGLGLYHWLKKRKSDDLKGEIAQKGASKMGPLLSAGLGAALLGGAALSARSYHKKYASTDDLVRAIQTSSLSSEEKRRLVNGVRQLSPIEQKSLSFSTRGAVGAALGAIVARYLRSKGLLPVIMGSIIGGAVGHFSKTTPKRNAMGQYRRTTTWNQ
jgi:hypothetical protein